MSRHYANYRYGGKTEKTNTSEANTYSNEINLSEPEYRIKELNNQDTLVISKRNIKAETKILSNEKINTNPDSLSSKDTNFVMDDALGTDFGAAAFNGIGAILGFLTFVNANFLYVSLPIYVLALPVFNVIGIICFFFSLAQFSQGKLDNRNKKYYKIWFFVYCLSVLLALIPLLMFI
jgi:hypothetical protein